MTTSSALTGGVATFNPTPSIERSHDVVVSVGRAVPSTADVVGVPVGTKGAVPRQLGLDRATLAESGFDAKVGQTLVVPRRDGATLVAVGIGDPADLTPATLRDAGAAFARAAAKHGALATTLAEVAPGVPADVAAQAIVEGVLLARYRYGALKRDTPAAGLRELTLVVTAPRTAAVGARRRTRPRRRQRRAAGPRPRQHPARPPHRDAHGRRRHRRRRGVEAQGRGVRRRRAAPARLRRHPRRQRRQHRAAAHDQAVVPRRPVRPGTWPSSARA